MCVRYSWCSFQDHTADHPTRDHARNGGEPPPDALARSRNRVILVQTHARPSHPDTGGAIGPVRGAVASEHVRTRAKRADSASRALIHRRLRPAPVRNLCASAFCFLLLLLYQNRHPDETSWRSAPPAHREAVFLASRPNPSVGAGFLRALLDGGRPFRLTNCPSMPNGTGSKPGRSGKKPV